jgi:hypothetical protein
MTEENNLREDANTDDDVLRRKSSNEIISEENSSDENLNEEELDLYDFLGVISDKIDNITTQSKTKSRILLIFLEKLTCFLFNS